MKKLLKPKTYFNCVLDKWGLAIYLLDGQYGPLWEKTHKLTKTDILYSRKFGSVIVRGLLEKRARPLSDKELEHRNRKESDGDQP